MGQMGLVVIIISTKCLLFAEIGSHVYNIKMCSNTFVSCLSQLLVEKKVIGVGFKL